MEFRVLGPLEVLEDGRQIDLGGAKQRALLALLLLHANEVVSSDRLIDALWEGEPPQTAPKALQVYVSQLRKTLGRDRLETKTPGYRLRVGEGELDLDRSERLAQDGDPRAALALWRGQPLAEFAYQRFAQAEIGRLDEFRLGCLERRIEADLEQGRHAELVGELEALVREQPVRERLRGQLMLALYRSGRQAEALDAYQDARKALVDELGIEPSRGLRDLQQAILEQDASLDLTVEARPAAPVHADSQVAAPVGPQFGHESRKIVTALSAAISGSPISGAGLDAEALRRVTSVVFTRVSEAVKAHGGKVESVSAEAMSAVFGVPEVHEDDTLRAVRAAVDIHDSLMDVAHEHLDERGIELEVQIGISTGEVVVGGEAEATLLVTGAPFIKAERLARGAEPGETFLDDATVQRVGRLVDGEPETVGGHRAFRLSRVRESADEPRLSSPMVGRERERRRLVDAYEQAIADRSCQLFTILGAAGVGKSRLVQESLEGVGGDVLVARGRCLPYGEGITYWPLLEAVQDAVGLESAESPEQQLARLTALLEEERDAEIVSRRVGELVGLVEIGSAGAEESFSAVRVLFESLARRRPLVIVFDDVHWGEATFLDLIEHVADWVREAPLLLVCVARPELLDVRPTWGGGKLNATTVLLEPLSEEESAELVGSLAGDRLSESVRGRIVGASEGNPVFVEEMLALALEDGDPDAELAVPPTIQALLAARLDRLGEAERSVIEPAAVEGKVFHEGSVAELSPAALRPTVAAPLAGLVRKQLIRPDKPVFPGEQAYRFRHLLIRDAAYDSIPKEVRAELHERHALWLEVKVGDRAAEYDEIVGYHLEQAFRYKAELGSRDDEAGDLGRRAAERLGTAGRRAFLRSDAPAGAKLISRAVALLPADDPLRVELVPNVRVIQGLSDLSWADKVLTDAVEAAATTGNRRLAAHALVQRGLLRLFVDADVTPAELFDVSERAIAAFEELDDELGLARAWRLTAQAHYLDRRAQACVEASERALVHARRSGDVFERREILEWLGIALLLGPSPAANARRRCEELLEEFSSHPSIAAELLAILSALTAMEGDVDDALDLWSRARRIMDETDEWIWISSFWHAFIHDWRGRPSEAEPELRPAYESLKRIGEKSHFSSITHALAAIAYSQGRYDEAEALTLECEEACGANDIHSHVAWRAIRAKVLAYRGAFESADSLSREAVAYALDSDFLLARSDALADRAEVLLLAGHVDAAAAELERAIQVDEQKGNVLLARARRQRFARLVETHAVGDGPGARA